MPAFASAAPALEVSLSPVGAWTDAAGSGAVAAQPQSFDALGHLSALVRYDVDLPDGKGGQLLIDEVRDLAWVSVDGVAVGTLSRTRHDRAIRIPAGRTLSILVEDQGRVNYDHRLGEEKGLIGAVTLDGTVVTGWRSTPLDVAAIAGTIAAALTSDSARDEVPGSPLAWTAEFDLDTASDLFLDTAPWSKGYAFVNGFFLGRYWRNGPQRTLYVPAPATRTGGNRLVVLELEQILVPVARFVEAPALGVTEE